ncbi:MAG: hypothetical protein IT342_02245 [Candidatus Melainabacteria bacterium]|nr:hypothetical protein [Candidatus Melainabacteria bacterium]
MPRFEKTDTNPESMQASSANSPSPVDWLGANFVNPFVNTLCIEPANAVAWAVDTSSGQKEAHRLTPLPVPRQSAKTTFPEVLCQGVASAMGSVIPYALAGRLTGNTMRFAGATLQAEGVLAKFAQSEKAAQILGGGIYDGMKETHAGETHLRNGAAGAVNFAILEYWKRASKSSTLGRALDRFYAGMFGAFAHIAVARPDVMCLDRKSSDLDMGSAILTNGLMNALLPGTQEGIRLLQDKATIKMGLGVPVDRYLKTSNLARHDFSGKNESSLLEQNRWARIEPNAQFSSYQHGSDMVSLKGDACKWTFLHELQHRKEALSGKAEPGFVRAASLLSKDSDQAWYVYKSVRLAQEIRAELANYHRTALPKYSDAVYELKIKIPYSGAAGGVPYITIWRIEFKEFMRSKGKYRPERDFSVRHTDRELESEANKLNVRLSARQPYAAEAISSVMARPDLKTEQVTRVFKHINEFLDPRQAHTILLPLDRLAMQTLRLAAKPEKVAQGTNPTCGPASVEYITYVKHPENAADLISQVVRRHKYDCADGSSIIVNGLNVLPERYWHRSFANQLFQTTAVNVHWQRKNNLEPWLTKDDSPNIDIAPGKTRYQRLATTQLNESPYRLIDYSKEPPALIYDRLPPALKDDPADPLMNHESLNDINNQINGAAGGAVALPWDLSSPQQLNSLLAARRLTGKLPVITVVDSKHPLFRDGLSDPSAGSWHSVVIKSFDPIEKVVSLFNPWGNLIDNVSIKQVFEANKEQKVTGSHKTL